MYVKAFSAHLHLHHIPIVYIYNGVPEEKRMFANDMTVAAVVVSILRESLQEFGRKYLRESMYISAKPLVKTPNTWYCFDFSGGDRRQTKTKIICLLPLDFRYSKLITRRECQKERVCLFISCSFTPTWRRRCKLPLNLNIT